MQFFTSDFHLSHSRILEYCKRPFSSVEEMDEEIVTRYNAIVSAKDEVWMLGDLVFQDSAVVKYLARMNGKKNLIIGNHDRKKLNIYKEHNIFQTVNYYYELNTQNPETGERAIIILFHYALETWNRAHYGAIHLHGHSHGTLLPRGKRLDIGVDTHNFRPWSINEVFEDMKTKSYSKVDHHE